MTPAEFKAMRAWCLAHMPKKGTPTPGQHEAHVAETGRPYTQPQWDTLGRKPPEHRPAERD